MKKNIVIRVLIFGLSFQKLSAQVNVSPSLNSAIAAATEKSFIIKNQILEHQKADDERKAIWNKYLPTVSANAAYLYMDNDLKLDFPAVIVPLNGATLFEGSSNSRNHANFFMGGVTAKQVLFSGGQIMNGAKAITAKNEGNAFMDELKKDEIIKEVIGSFDNLRFLVQADALIKESEMRLQKERLRVEKAIQQGLAVPYDRDKIKLANLNLESKKAEIKGKRELLYLKINNLTGFDNNQIDAVTYELETIEVVADLGVEERNELKAMSSYSKALEYNLKKEKGSLLPTVGALASYSYASLFNANTRFNLPITGNRAELSLNQATLFPNWVVGGILKWELFGGFERKHKIEAVKIDQYILANKKEDALQMMNLQLKNNLVAYKVQINQLRIAELQEIIAKDNLTTAEKQYKLGLINVSERLVAEIDVYEMSLNRIQKLISQRQAALDVYAASKPLYNFIQVK